MPRLNDMFPSKYLKAADLEDGDLIVTIKGIEEEQIGPTRDDKWVLYFHETNKGLVMNKVNSNTIAKIHGDDTDDWEGKRITLFATEVQFQGDMVAAIRVRMKAPKGKPSRADGRPDAGPEPAAAPVTPRPDSIENEEGDDIPF